jgi:ABC-type glycerol-3-phosphate transport system permease component
MSPARLERLLVVLIAVHSYAVGFALLFLTEWGSRLGGWEHVTPLFFPRQAGAFHLVVATGYLMEYQRSRGVTLLLTTKAIAVAFLFSTTLLDHVPWVVPLSGVADGLMGLTVWGVRSWVKGREVR